MNKAIIPEEKVKLSFSRFFNDSRVENIFILKGDASTRSYARLELKGFQNPTAVVMVMGSFERAIVPEEFVEEISRFTEIPFLNIHRYLRRAGMRVPEIYGYDRENGFIFLEDFGDDVLEKRVLRSRKFPVEIYTDALNQLINLQRFSIKNRDPECYAFRLKFTEGVFMWEFEHFIEFIIDKGYGVKASPSEKEELRALFSHISKQCGSLSRVFTHRDYHSRNLMILKDGAGVLDFQDALTGPAFYDIVSLLRDSYVEIPEEVEEELKALFIKNADYLLAEERERFDYFFELCALQRNLKAAGRFSYINERKNNPSFLPYIKPTLKKALRAIEKIYSTDRRFKTLSRVIEKAIIDDEKT